jgi:hypothetical protein
MTRIIEWSGTALDGTIHVRFGLEESEVVCAMDELQAVQLIVVERAEDR